MTVENVIWVNYAVGICISLGAWCFFIWAIRDGQFKDAEEAKYRMMENDESE